MVEREIMKNDVPELWRQRAHAGLCPVCGKTQQEFKKGMRVYCSKKCRDEYASKYTFWTDVRNKFLREHGEYCDKCSITIDKYKMFVKEEKQKYREKLLLNPKIRKQIEEERDVQLVKWSESWEERYKEIMDDHYILEHLFYSSELYEDLDLPNYISFEVDHKTAIVNGGDLWDVSNFQVLCTECHKKKTQDDLKLVRQKNNKNSILIKENQS
jgi:5-methylcytosine-specific restriction endonuclease McrA